MQDDGRPWPQAGRKRVIALPSVARLGTGMPEPVPPGPDGVMMMGDNPALPRMPEKPQLLDFYRLRLLEGTVQHLFNSAKLALEAGQAEPIILACLLHDISLGALVRTDHGYWSAQLIAPYVSEEVAFAVRYHQALRFFPDESVGYAYPETYTRFFGEDYAPPDYIRREAEIARAHKWYMSARFITLHDVYAFDNKEPIDPALFADIIGRHFRTPPEGLGFDNSPTAHMWRTLIWPNNFL
jgi:hypothetical protein